MSEVVNVYEKFKEHIREALRGMTGVSVDTNGFYYTECYTDYRDELEDSTIAEILQAPFPMNKFEEHIQWAYSDAMIDIENEVFNNLKDNDVIAGFMANMALTEDDLRTCLCDVWYAHAPYEAFLKQEVCMDISLDTGDCNYEFTCNNLASTDIESVEDFDDNSSLLWLCEQQGITREELLAAFNKGTAHSDVVEELRTRKNELVEALKGYGFKTPRFNESVIHTGAYREFTKLQERQDTLRAGIATLSVKHEENNISYKEYLKKHFDRFERLDPMSEEQFNVKKAEILDNLNTKLKGFQNELAGIDEKLSGSVDFAEVARLQGEYNDVRRLLSDLSKTDAYKKAEFINSVHNEILNTYGSSVVTFLVKMPLEEAIHLKNVIYGEKELNNSYYYEERKGQASITIDKGVCCGLMDECSGKGSVFEIKLIKDVEIPVKALYRAVPDKCNGNYGFMEIYGANDELFSESLKEIHEARPLMVEELIADATEKVGDIKDAPTDKDSYELD